MSEKRVWNDLIKTFGIFTDVLINNALVFWISGAEFFGRDICGDYFSAIHITGGTNTGKSFAIFVITKNFLVIGTGEFGVSGESFRTICGKDGLSGVTKNGAERIFGNFTKV